MICDIFDNKNIYYIYMHINLYKLCSEIYKAEIDLGESLD